MQFSDLINIAYRFQELQKEHNLPGKFDQLGSTLNQVATQPQQTQHHANMLVSKDALLEAGLRGWQWMALNQY